MTKLTTSPHEDMEVDQSPKLELGFKQADLRIEQLNSLISDILDMPRERDLVLSELQQVRDLVLEAD